MMHNQEVKAVETSEGSSDEMWSFVCLAGEVELGDGWMGVSIAEDSGLILTAGVGKHTDELEERVLPENIEHYIGKDKTQKIRQQTGRFHRRQNKFSKRLMGLDKDCGQAVRDICKLDLD